MFSLVVSCRARDIFIGIKGLHILVFIKGSTSEKCSRKIQNAIRFVYGM
jgi:hypothetical protein